MGFLMNHELTEGTLLDLDEIMSRTIGKLIIIIIIITIVTNILGEADNEDVIIKDCCPILHHILYHIIKSLCNEKVPLMLILILMLILMLMLISRMSIEIILLLHP